jgi:hypothetical protein
MRLAAEAQESLRDKFSSFQCWVRKELDEHGVVMVDDEFLAGREDARQWAREAYERIVNRMDELFTDSDYGSYSDMYDTDTDEEEEVALRE